jgi:hypothetical protein
LNVFKSFGASALVVAVVALAPAEAQAVPYTFSNCLTANWSGCSSLPAQMKVDVTDAGGGYVDFKFTNDVGISSSITAIYFDADGLFKSIAVQSESAGVDFKTGSLSPPNVPGANGATPPFQMTVIPKAGPDISLGADTQGSPNGINSASEYLVLRLKLNDTKTFNDIINALDDGPGVDSLRIAAHIQSLPGGQSDSIICCGTGTGVPSPEPASIALFGIVAIALAQRMRRRQSA